MKRKDFLKKVLYMGFLFPIIQQYSFGMSMTQIEKYSNDKNIKKRIYNILVSLGFVSQEGFNNFNWKVRLEDLAMDSLDVVDFIMDIEKEFNISVSDLDLEFLTGNIQDVVDYVSNGGKISSAKIGVIFFTEKNFKGTQKRIRSSDIEIQKFKNLSIYRSMTINKGNTVYFLNNDDIIYTISAYSKNINITNVSYLTFEKVVDRKIWKKMSLFIYANKIIVTPSK
jgi:acyl carrier protein